MKTWKKIVILLVIALIVIQLFRPEKNATKADPVNDIATKYDVPMDVLMTLYNACYNCHSNYTKYPWYFKVQPVAWWMTHHIDKAKKHVNFSEFATYSPKKAAHKLHEIEEQMTDQTMPITSYKLMHKDAHLSDEEYKDVADWAKKLQAEIEAKADSVKG